MRVLFLNQFYVPDTAATGQLLADVAEDLAAKGHEVHVVCSRRRYTGGSDQFPVQELLHGVHVHRVGATGFGRGRMIGRLFDYLSFYVLALVKAVHLGRIDVCVALTTPPFIALIGALLRNLRGTQLVVWSMDVYPEVAIAYGVLKPGGVLSGLLRALSRYIYGSAGAVISLGETMTERLTQAGVPRERITVAHNWAPHESAQPSAAY